MFIKIAKIGNNETICFAAAELKKYLSQMDPVHEYAILRYDTYNASLENVLWIGLSDEFDLPDVKNNELDDAVSIQVDGCAGYITGNNYRSVLIAAYRFLRELGCAFFRPGTDGELVPQVCVTDKKISVFEAASYRHRAVCIEGADSYNDVVNFIEWLPKVGLNGFYNQFKIPHTFYHRWYTHKHNTEEFEAYDINSAISEGISNETVNEIKKRGLLYHAIGHGWTCEPFGIEGNGWFEYQGDVPQSVSKNLALVDGKREFWKGVPLNTNLCYSSVDVQETVANAVLSYSQSHPETDYVHVWLADGTNNHCECDDCRKMRPSDYYVQLLNRIDDKLSASGLNTKIVFLIYVDLLWSPIKEKINNPERFVLMFAPITRTYSSSVTQSVEFDGNLADYNRNNNLMPSSFAENISHLNNWQKMFNGDSFDFDYHYMWDHFKDLGNYKIAKVLFDDMQNLDKIGLNGMVSCQCIRAFFPHGLGMNAMAAALWDKNADFNTVATEYFNKAFGKDGTEVFSFMKQISEISDPVFVRGEYDDIVSLDRVKRFESAYSLIDEFKSVIERNLNKDTESVRLSYFYLSYFADYAKLFINWEIALAKGEVQTADFALQELIDYVKKSERHIHRIFDCYVFRATMNKCENKLIAKI